MIQTASSVSLTPPGGLLIPLSSAMSSLRSVLSAFGFRKKKKLGLGFTRNPSLGLARISAPPLGVNPSSRTSRGLTRGDVVLALRTQRLRIQKKGGLGYNAKSEPWAMLLGARHASLRANPGLTRNPGLSAFGFRVGVRVKVNAGNPNPEFVRKSPALLYTPFVRVNPKA